ncbi:3-deoxy-7-phosphoheptulonate synthase [Luminiphilus syltensis NOR5-1B]|uniref:Phospho-2-dehydro-3-deoxyheptonate aldolase n=1 Tax=Luminiphilus syltensis NOR5-1B TaxID=565045 RepID=B8KQY6_9GAMM|nr:3-deoxy-7-phosphoheptulonate synthase [Luminiphilus syltensis]EED36202.1 3-deoxy-7-phosphoheptulonate synthase [Luminiphilus syltensis NOR5-1B]
MDISRIHNVNVAAQRVLKAPSELRASVPIADSTFDFVAESRRTIERILDREDHRLMIVVGPCSIHDPNAAMEYAQRLKQLAEHVQDSLYVVMRVYFEKPRTTVGWKGLINDPHMDDSFDIEAGLSLGRTLLRDILDQGLPTATEALDPITPQYMQDLISWSAIGARTTESQTHREMASGLSSAVGFKNGTDGGLDVAINAMQSVCNPHRFLGINSEGKVSVFETRGNRYSHMVLRGGTRGPNYDSVHTTLCEQALEKAQLPKSIMVDCSHANSEKNPELQPLVAENVCHQICDGNDSIIGIMLESHLNAGNQKIPDNLEDLEYGVSVTDGCIDWQTTETLLLKLAESLRPVLPERIERYHSRDR